MLMSLLEMKVKLEEKKQFSISTYNAYLQLYLIRPSSKKLLHNFQPCMSHKDSENLHEFNYHFQPLLHLDFGEISCKIVTENDYLFAGNCIG